MAELLAQIIRNIVEAPDQVKVDVTKDERGVTFQVQVAPDDMGKVIGRDGRIINALRMLVRSAPRGGGRIQRVQIELVQQ